MNVFLNGDLEEVYMEIHSGLKTKININKVTILKKSLYGLKQSPRAWFDCFTKAIKRFGYSQCQSNHTLFVKHTTEGRTVIIIIYVDDIILIGDHEEEIGKLNSFLAHEFEIKDLGNLKKFLRMEIPRSKMGIAVSQHKHILVLLKETRMLDCKPTDTSMDYITKLGTVKGITLANKGRYQRHGEIHLSLSNKARHCFFNWHG